MDIKKHILKKCRLYSLVDVVITGFVALLVFYIVSGVILFVTGTRMRFSWSFVYLTAPLPVIAGIIGFYSKRMQMYSLRKWRNRIEKKRSEDTAWYEREHAKRLNENIHDIQESKDERIRLYKDLINSIEKVKKEHLVDLRWGHYPHQKSAEQDLIRFRELLSEAEAVDVEALENKAFDDWNNKKAFHTKFNKRMERLQKQIALFDEMLKN